MAGFPRLLRTVATAYQDRKREMRTGGGQVLSALHSLAPLSRKAESLSHGLIKRAYSSLLRSYDWKNGGFGGAPKFPETSALGFLLRGAFGRKPGRAIEMVERALAGMAGGGIRDQLGGGFHRYSVDEKWLVPHFEKMLYDNAMLARIYLDAYVATRNKEYAEVARETLEYVLGEMTGPGGGFYSSQDADSEGREGTYYLWNNEEILSLLGEKEGKIVARFLGADEGGNLEGKLNVLHRPISIEALGRLFDVDVGEAQRMIDRGKRVLFEAREKRARPFRDEKIISSWNGLMLGAMARGYQVLGDARFLEAVRKAGDFMLAELRGNEGLLHVWVQGKAKVPGFLEDYALVAEGLLDVWEADFNVRWLREAMGLAEELTRLFWDDRNQRFSSTGPKHEKLIADVPAIQDDPFPSGNAAAVHLLLRMAALTDESSYAEKAGQVLRSFSGVMEESPEAVPHLLSGLHRYLSPPIQVVIVGGEDAAEIEAHLAAARSVYLPNATIVFTAGHDAEELHRVVPLAQGKSLVDGKTTTYVCVNRTCLAPITDFEALGKELRDIQRERANSG